MIRYYSIQYYSYGRNFVNRGILHNIPLFRLGILQWKYSYKFECVGNIVVELKTKPMRTFSSLLKNDLQLSNSGGSVRCSWLVKWEHLRDGH